VRLVRDNRIDLLAVQEYTPGARDKLRAAGIDALLPYRLDDAEPLAVGAALFSRVSLENGHLSVAPGGFVEVTATLRLPGRRPGRRPLRSPVRAVHPCAPRVLAQRPGSRTAGHDRRCAEPAAG